MTKKLSIEAQGERELVFRRAFDAPRTLVWDAHTRPELIRKWLGARGGWTFAVCEVDLRVGGKYRWVWRNDAAGMEMGMGGEYLEIDAPARLVNTEHFDDAWYPGDAVGTMVLVEKGGKTTLTTTMRYESRAARDAVLASPMESGLTESYDNLERLLTEQQGS